MASIYSIRGENKAAIDLLSEVHPVSLDYMSWTLSPMSKDLRRDPQFLYILNAAKNEVERMRMVVLETSG